MTINWNNIRSLENSQNEGFEELVCQLARNENTTNRKKFIRKGKPDAGVECFWVLDNDNEEVWQAKFWTSSLENSQWTQADSSVKTALDKHPKMVKFYLAMPIDPPDARLANTTSMLEKWEQRVSKWEGWAADRSMTVEFVAWWSSDLIDRLSKTENSGLTYFWFNKEEFTEGWFKEQAAHAIQNLGKRYIPNIYKDLNVKLEIAKNFDALSRTPVFYDEVRTCLDSVVSVGKNVIRERKAYKASADGVENLIAELESHFKTLPIDGVDTAAFATVSKLIENFDDIINEYRTYYRENRESLFGDDRNNKFNHATENIHQLWLGLNRYKSFLSSSKCRLFDEPYLILKGEAGLGKSHLLADTVNERMNAGMHSLLILGQQLNTTEPPWVQIKKALDIKCSFDEFLGACNARAQASGHRLMIFIDAINEGKGKNIWPDNIRGFVEKIKKYDWLGLVLSVRTTYADLLTPIYVLPTTLIERITHQGFGDDYELATETFFENFGITLPSIPLLNPEFNNPLFLLIFCEGLSKSGHRTVPEGHTGFSKIIDFYIDSIHSKLTQSNIQGYPTGINVVRKVIDAFVAKLSEDPFSSISYEEAFMLVKEEGDRFGVNNCLIENLIEEGVFFKDYFGEDRVSLTYERFEDHFLAQYLLKKSDDLETEFKAEGLIGRYFTEQNDLFRFQGLLEALAVQLPEQSECELYELLPQYAEENPIVSSVIKSLLWRSHDSLSNKLEKYIEDVIVDGDLEDQFYDTLFSVAGTPGHYFNANYLHRELLSYDMPNRDAWWSIYISGVHSDLDAATRLIDWCWSDKERYYLSDESVMLLATALIWLLPTTNKKLRDNTTRALVSLLKNRIQVLISILHKFDGVDEPYIVERLYAVVYGCVLHSDQEGLISALSETVINLIFKVDGEIYPNALVRDYACGVVEFANHKIDDYFPDMVLARPPYNSTLPMVGLTNEEIDALYEFYSKGQKLPNHMYAGDRIISSMTTEYSRGTSRYGDFGRYTFQYYLNHWDVNVDVLSNIAVEWIFKDYGYDAKLHGRFDHGSGLRGSRMGSNVERIGKKYQWIAMYEMLARVSDNCQFKEDSYSEVAQSYLGSWNPNFRNIDPTYLIKELLPKPAHIWWQYQPDFDWSVSNDDWVKDETDIPEASNFISVIDDSKTEWLVLEGYPESSEPKPLGAESWNFPRKNIWHHIHCYLVPKADASKLKSWAENQNFMGRWMPEHTERYEVFDKEYYWSSAFESFDNDYHLGKEVRSVQEPNSSNKIAEVYMTSKLYAWEKSVEGHINLLKPSKFLFDGMKMRESDRPGIFHDSNGDLICFTSLIYEDTKSFLLVRKDVFLAFLEEKELEPIWTVLAEKNVLGGFGGHIGRVELSGAYHFDVNFHLKGKVNVKK